MLKKVLIGVAVVLVGFVALVASRPSHFLVERSASLAAPSALAFAQVNNLKNWAAWSPWEGLDPAAKKTFEGPAEGMGARYRWSGNDQVGEGQMTITESKPSEAVVLQLEFLRPFQSTATATFSFQSTPEGCGVKWAMTGESNFLSKAMGLFMNMDKMLGADFEKGLASMKKVAEAEAQKQKAAEEAAKTAAAPAPSADQPAQAAAH